MLHVDRNNIVLFVCYYSNNYTYLVSSPGPKVQIGPGSHVEYPTGTKNRYFVEDHPRNIPAKFGSNWPSGFGEEA
jgi:hypothetical protein